MLRRSVEVGFHQDVLYAEFPLSETPYISSMDADDEVITIYNPSNTEVIMKDYYVVDHRRLHKFVFTEEDDIVLPHGTLHLYTCPKLSMERNNSFKEPYVLWRNLDGSLRRKEVLNNEHCEMLLYAPNHKCIASCSTTRHGKNEVKRREEELCALPSFQLSLTSRWFISVLRIILLLAFTVCALEHHQYRIPLYWVAFLADLLSREVGTHEAYHSLATLNRYGDDICVSVLYLSAVLFCSRAPLSSDDLFRAYTNSGLRVALIVGCLLEFTAMSAIAGAVSDSSPSSSDEDTIGLHRGRHSSFHEHETDRVYAVLRHIHPALVTFVCLGSEIFLLSYVPDAAWPESLSTESLTTESAFALVTLGAFVLRSLNNCSAILFRVHHRFTSAM